MAGDAFAMACLASLADADITLPDGTSLGLGNFTITPSDDPAALDPPDFAQLAEEFKDVFKLPKGLPPDRGPEFTLRIDTGDEPMPRSRQLKRLTQGELNKCSRQIAYLLDQGWMFPRGPPTPRLWCLPRKRTAPGGSARTTAA